MTETTPKPPVAPLDYAVLFKRSLAAIDELEAKLATAQRQQREAIAIVGMACRFPGDANTPQAFWSLLRDGVDAVTEVPLERWDINSYYDPDPDAVGKTYTRWGAFVDNVDRFDAAFFGISPREAISLDPQQRLLLEVTWEALENAGIAPSSLAGSATAVYMGITTADYAMRMAESAGFRNGDAYTSSGTAHSVAAGRLSYFLGVHGPNAAIDTACSSSLVALHWAMQSLRKGEANMALAGGVNLTLSADGSILTSRARMMSSDGRCKTFDASANGYVRGEGCGILVLKRLSDAQRDGDTVLAVIRGSAINHDGRSSGLSAPNGLAQEALMRAALADAGLAADDIDYIEAHGTGTPLGDPIEIKALGEVFGQRSADRALRVGSVKTNIGHLEAAAGIAGVIKTVLAIQHRTIPPHLHLRQPNPLIDWARYRIEVPLQATAWQTHADAPRRAGISSFGFSGTNAHLVIEEAPVAHAPVIAASTTAARSELLVISAQSGAALKELASRYCGTIAAGTLARSAHGSPSLAAVAASAALGRSHFAERLAVVASSADEAYRQLAAFAATGLPSDGTFYGRSSGSVPEIVFMFTGQGSQYVGMAQQLFETEPVFRAMLEECERLLAPLLPRSLFSVIFAEDPSDPAINDTAFTQPALFAVEYALTHLWRSWGIEPTVVLGHSVGEFVAACVAGVFSLEDGLKLIAARGRLMSGLRRDGTMAAVFATEAQVDHVLSGYKRTVSVAAINGPRSVVISGVASDVATILARLAGEGIDSQTLQVSHGFHSPLMEPMLDEFESLVGKVRLSPPRIGVISNLTGKLISPELCDPQYWRRQTRGAVQFAGSIATALAEGYKLFLEIGPNATLAQMARHCEGGAEAVWLGSLRKGRGDRDQLLRTLGELYVRGARPNWFGVVGPEAVLQRAALPTYPFQREHYWVEYKEKKTSIPKGVHALLGAPQIAEPPNASFAVIVARDEPAFLADHVVLGRTLFPGAAFIEMALAAAKAVMPGMSPVLRRFSIEAPLGLSEGETETLVTQVEEKDGRSQIRIRHVGEKAWRDLARCQVEISVTAPAGGMVAELRAAKLEPVEVTAYYSRLEDVGVAYGPNFRGVRQLWSSPNGALGRIELPADAPGARDLYNIHPALLDAAFQVMGGALLSTDSARGDVFLPIGAEAIRWLRPAGRALWVGIKVNAGDDPDVRIVDIALENDGGELVGVIDGLQVRRVNRDSLERALAGGARARTYRRTWREIIGGSEPKSPPTTYLVVGGTGAVGPGLAECLIKSGATARVIGSYEPAMLRAAIADGDLPNWVITCDLVENHCEGLDPPAQAAIMYGRHLVLAQVLAEFAPRAGLCILTRGAQAIEPGDPGDPAQSAVIGFARTLAAERPEAPSFRLDLDPWAPIDAAQVADLVARLVGAEVEVAVRHGSTFAQRLEPLAKAAQPEVTQRQVVRIETRGDLDNLRLIEERRRAPGRGEVEIDVRAAGLNFRDVLNALDMYPGDAGRLGSEVSGIVSVLGPGVVDFAVGDPVIAFTGDSISTYAVASSVLTAKLPAGVDFADAVTVPNTYMTAALCFSAAGGLKPGMRVLVHAGAGGVGLAAIRLARLAGVEIFATAGSPTKRAFVLDEGASRVFDSRKAAFADEIMTATDGAGVDIVVNSLTGAFIPENFRALRSGGAFVEIGKAEILTQEQAAAYRSDVRYMVKDLGEEVVRDAGEVGRGLARAAHDVASRRTPPLPVQAFALEEANSAFRFMANARHTGKIVLLPKRAPTPRRDGTYLVTGGLGGLGLATARWLARRGAGQIVLTARSEPSAEQMAAVAALGDGSSVRIARCDVGDRAALEAMVSEIMASELPLRGVFHAAGVLDDATLDGQNQARYAKVAGAKSNAAWWLSELTSGAQLDFFVLFSSISSVFGSPGQANYSASNAFLDGLATWRRAHGRVATSIAWGGWDEVGMAVKLDEKTRARAVQVGLGLLQPQKALAAMEDALAADVDQAVIMAVDSVRFVEQASPYVASLFANLVVAKGNAAADGSEYDADISSDDPARRQVAVAAFVRKEIARVLGSSAASLDENAPLHELGLNSLMAVQFRNAIGARLGFDVSLKRLLQGVTAAELIVELSREEFVL